MSNTQIPTDPKENLARMRSICDRMVRQKENLENILQRKQTALSLAESDPQTPALLKYKLNRDCEDLVGDLKVLEGRINWNLDHQETIKDFIEDTALATTPLTQRPFSALAEEV